MPLQYFKHLDGLPFGQDGIARVHAVMSVPLRRAMAFVEGRVGFVRDLLKGGSRSPRKTHSPSEGHPDGPRDRTAWRSVFRGS